MKMNLQARLDKLKARPEAWDLPKMFKNLYLMMVQADYVTGGDAASGRPWPEFLAEWQKKHGPMQESIEKSMERWKRTHRKGGRQ